jgi:hypothetical protein
MRTLLAYLRKTPELHHAMLSTGEFTRLVIGRMKRRKRAFTDRSLPVVTK